MRRHLFLSFLLVIALISNSAGIGYGQEARRILSVEAFDMLNTVPDTYLVDIRTQPEYQFVGHPLKAYNYPYLFFTTTFSKDEEKPSYQLTKNKVFLEQIGKVFKKTDNLLLLDRDGTRSAQAAKELLTAGYKNVFDVYDGLKGVSSPPLTIPTSTSTTDSLPRETTFTVSNIDAIRDGNFGGFPGPMKWIPSTCIRLTWESRRNEVKRR